MNTLRNIFKYAALAIGLFLTACSQDRPNEDVELGSLPVETPPDSSDNEGVSDYILLLIKMAKEDLIFDPKNPKQYSQDEMDFYLSRWRTLPIISQEEIDSLIIK